MSVSAVLSYSCWLLVLLLFFDGATASKQNTVSTTSLSAVLSYSCWLLVLVMFFDGATASKQSTVSTTCQCLLS